MGMKGSKKKAREAASGGEQEPLASPLFSLLSSLLPLKGGGRSPELDQPLPLSVKESGRDCPQDGLLLKQSPSPSP